MDSGVAAVFHMSDPVKLCVNRLEQLGTELTGRVHSSRLKNQILAYFPDMFAGTKGREVAHICNEDVGPALQKSCEYDADSDAIILARAANIVRRDMLKMKTRFSGSFGDQCQEESKPSSLSA